MAPVRRSAYDLLLEVDHVVPHVDADGLSSAAIALHARGGSAADAVLLERGQVPFGDDPPVPEGSVALLDWGVRSTSRHGLIVDHHAPEAEPGAHQLVVSGHGEVPEVSTSVLMRRIVPAAPSWLAAVGAYGDLGTGAWKLPECAGAPRTLVARLTGLVNAPRRGRDGAVADALAVLVDNDTPQEALQDERLPLLEEAKARWQDAYRAALKVGPEVHGGVALIRLSSDYQVHPVVATTWERRLAPAVVIAANENYIPGRVNFAIRGGEGDLRALLRQALPEGEGEFAHGHPRATGGSLTPHQFELLIQRLRAGAAS